MAQQSYNPTLPTVAPSGTGSPDDTYLYLTMADKFDGLISSTLVPVSLVNVSGYNWLLAQLVVSDPVSGGTPTFAAKLQTSLDSVVWYDLFTFTSYTTSGGSNQQAGSRHMLVATALPMLLGKFLRFKFSVGSASGTPVYTVTPILLMGN